MRFLSFVFACFALYGCGVQAVKPTASHASDLRGLRADAGQAYAAADWATAARLYGKLARSGAPNAETWYRLGNALVHLGKADAAVDAYTQALSLQPDNTRIWHNLGMVRLHQATNALTALQAHARDGDPLKADAGRMIQSIEQALQPQVGPEEN